MKLHTLIQLAIGFILFAAPLGAKEGLKPLSAEETKRAIQEIENAAKGLKSLSCTFTQEKRLKLMQKSLISKGTLLYQAPSFLRWEYKEPYSYTFEIKENIVTTIYKNKVTRIDATILSRTQRIDCKPLTDEQIACALQQHCGLHAEDAQAVAHAAEGSYIKALQQVYMHADTAQFFDLFVLLMRLCYMRKVKELYQWADQLAQWGREKQKAFLAYCQRMVRENFVYNFHRPELNYMNRTEADFAVRFARFINERNVIGIADELSLAQRDIEGYDDNITVPFHVVMPNHVHIMIMQTGNNAIPEIIRRYKSETSCRYIEGVKSRGWQRFDGNLWQKSYFDHIIRNQRAHDYIAKYIIDNPKRWNKDNINPHHDNDIDEIMQHVKDLE